MTVIDIPALADALAEMLPALKLPPQDGYRERVMRISVEDVCDAGGIEVESIELEAGEPECIVAALRRCGQ
jgi:hypothetical protein